MTQNNSCDVSYLICLWCVWNPKALLVSSVETALLVMRLKQGVVVSRRVRVGSGVWMMLNHSCA